MREAILLADAVQYWNTRRMSSCAARWKDHVAYKQLTKRTAVIYKTELYLKKGYEAWIVEVRHRNTLKPLAIEQHTFNVK